MRDRLLLLHGLGGNKMNKYRNYTHPVTRSVVRKRTRKHKRNMGSLGMDFSVAQKGITASIGAVKSVGMVSLVAAGGAVATDYIFKELLADSKKEGYDILSMKNGSTAQNVAKAVFGLVGGIVIGKFLKKPQMGAAFAIGAVAMALYNIVNAEVINKQPTAPTPTTGIGYIEARNAREFVPRPMSLGAQRVQTPGFKPQVAPEMAGYGSY